MTLTPVEIEETTHELVVLLARERRLAEAKPVSPEASERKRETLARLHGEIRRVSALLDAVPDGRKEPA